MHGAAAVLPVHGGDRVAEVLARHGVRFVFTLCGGHVSPILTGAKRRGLRVVDTRHEATAVFAADATSRLSGIPGVAVVTAGPGVTNTITALKNAQLAQSAVVLIGGASATVLRGRGALQDIDQRPLVRPHVKAMFAVTRVKNLAPAVDRAFAIAREGVPGPVFVEAPIDLLYEEKTVREWYLARGGGRTLLEKAESWYLRRHLDRLFGGVRDGAPAGEGPLELPEPRAVPEAVSLLARAERPVLVVGSQALAEAAGATALRAAVSALGVPVWLAGMARGLLGKEHPLQRRHHRKEALKEADLVILAGVPCDFRLDYGRSIRRATALVSANRSRRELRLNRRPTVASLGDAGRFVRALAAAAGDGAGRWLPWKEALGSRDAAREDEIATRTRETLPDGANPLALLRALDAAMGEDAVIVADGGDFVGTAAYTLRPRGPLSWIDPGAFGTLGCGAGFALAAKLLRPSAEVWTLFGDGSFGYALSEYDTFVRHGANVIGVVGNDASWAQIRRDQVEILGDDVATVLRRTDYHVAVEGLGAKGLVLRSDTESAATLAHAKMLAASTPVLVNAHIGKSEFRKGSISV